MERDVIGANGASAILQDRLFEQSDEYSIWLCRPWYVHYDLLLKSYGFLAVFQRLWQRQEKGAVLLVKESIFPLCEFHME
jgi:DNA-directed RNA polymerase beta subunit